MYPVSDPFVLGEDLNGPDILISETGDSHLIILLAHIVSLNHSGKDREAIGRVQGPIIVVGVHTSEILCPNTGVSRPVISMVTSNTQTLRSAMLYCNLMYTSY